ncbi:hypothetical protein V8E53_008254 [Lactarius tabidus]
MATHTTSRLVYPRTLSGHTLPSLPVISTEALSRMLPDFEPNITSPEHSPPPVHQSMARNAGSMKQSHISKFTKGHKRVTTEFAEANGAIPPRIHFQPESEPEQDSASEPEILGAKSPLDSDESMQDALTPIARLIEILLPEKLQSPSPAENLLTRAEHPSNTIDTSETLSPPTSHPLMQHPPSNSLPSLEMNFKRRLHREASLNFLDRLQRTI